MRKKQEGANFKEMKTFLSSGLISAKWVLLELRKDYN